MSPPTGVYSLKKSGKPVKVGEISAVIQTKADLIDAHRHGDKIITAPSIDPDEVKFLAKATEIDSKRLDEITKDDAGELQSEETRALGTPPRAGSLTFQVQSIADRNGLYGDVHE
ncbi:hypothetical protein AOQ84DRAFT_393328 [Glonium stellatum]|uniref:Uncharacterized protein n=1 Tax=Glonium stellatum TaxID=574774 RepID=A0A8E2ENE5_9PEZI|nr:hypothetical protein AOQ84DRAFT_393328 [Glonium stellatum]